MARIDVARLRKDYSMSQNELAQQLQINQSFLSAIENGRSPLPPEKEERLREIFGLTDLKAYSFDNTPDIGKVLAEVPESDLITHILTRLHSQAHNKEDEQHHHDHHDRITMLEEQNASLMRHIDSLMSRNDHLSETNDRLREEIDSLRAEIFRLKTGK